MAEERKLFDDVSERLKIHGLTYKWLLDKLDEKGMSVHKVSLSKWVHDGQRTPKAVEIHDMAMKIIDLYCKEFAEKVKEL
jgi:hypothetical protein